MVHVGSIGRVAGIFHVVCALAWCSCYCSFPFSPELPEHWRLATPPLARDRCSCDGRVVDNASQHVLQLEHVMMGGHGS